MTGELAYVRVTVANPIPRPSIIKLPRPERIPLDSTHRIHHGATQYTEELRICAICAICVICGGGFRPLLLSPSSS